MVGLFYFYTISIVRSLNILVWSPTYGQSHVIFMGIIADTLSVGGHNVVTSPVIILCPVLFRQCS